MYLYTDVGTQALCSVGTLWVTRTHVAAVAFKH